MEIKDLKQPYKRMAEYLNDENRKFTNLTDTFFVFYNKMIKGNYPPITDEIKKHFPKDFDFSGEEVKTKSVMQMLDIETQKAIYTQLAKEGRFDELPDTCEFSEAVDLEVWDEDITNHELRTVFGKFKGKYIAQNIYRPNQYLSWNYAKIPTPKIDFSEFKIGDVVEVETQDTSTKVGYIYSIGDNSIETALTKGKSGFVINKTEIKSITKIK